MGESASDLVIISGMSGAGRTEAMHAFEDLGYFCIDNLPACLIGDLIASMERRGDGETRLAVVCDARNQEFFVDLVDELATLREEGRAYRVLFLDASDDKLVARYKASRRRHPLCSEGMTIAQGIVQERALLYRLREMSQDVIDTTDLLPMQLRKRIRDIFSVGTDRDGLAVTVYSFGFKHGAPIDADIVIDVRFLPNPYYIDALRPLTGLDAAVRDYVMYDEETLEFVSRWKDLLSCVMPGYVKEGKQQLAIAVGCTGGQHRSVALAEATGDFLRGAGYRVSVSHRDLSLAHTDARGTSADSNGDAR
ncbi:RNase adapter RapZ [Slackia exigua]|uniref:Uncharacterized protein n=2 Tax=Slackia TaxID=84108 RepID=D0WEL9_SLAES|nr:RNase adapter RapZ [Slackia exigua]EEZ62157.1 hypothetical protein HMPREF0762_00249 [Slackia exigua ATCC 700122]STN98630.1 glmZ(sRNA)-inactivating NTPase [Slackia exigua]